MVCLDEMGFATGHEGCALDEVRPQRALRQEHLLGLQMQFSNNLIGDLGSPGYVSTRQQTRAMASGSTEPQ